MINSELYQRLKKALLRCEQFDNTQQLRSFFESNERLEPWQDSLPSYTTSRSGFVEAVIGFLIKNYRGNPKENVLVILVKLLAKNINIADSRHQTLAELAQELETVLSKNPDSKPEIEVTTKTDFKPEANSKGEAFSPIILSEKLLTCARAVAHISVSKIVNGNTNKVPTGTGWLVTPKLALTCWHVIEARGDRDGLVDDYNLQQQIKNSILTFDYTQFAQGIQYGVEKCEYKNYDLDYAVLRIGDRNDHPLENRGFLKLDRYAPLTKVLQLYVIQHLKGQPQHASTGFFVENDVSNNKQILHSAPTEKGTSGAPVLNVNNCQVVALHNGEDTNKGFRKATLISAILSDLESNCSNLYKEIVTAQTTYKE
ncbi:serine protease [Nostoc sp.]|uniref:trypsin-like serine peptidase n=1 Tax=Nostoc sp. TaxID=1180 RepID=UPI00359405F0